MLAPPEVTGPKPQTGPQGTPPKPTAPKKANQQQWQRTFLGEGNGVSFQLRLIRSPDGHLHGRYRATPGQGSGWHVEGTLREDNSFILKGTENNAVFEGSFTSGGMGIRTNFTNTTQGNTFQVQNMNLKFGFIPVRVQPPQAPGGEGGNNPDLDSGAISKMRRYKGKIGNDSLILFIISTDDRVYGIMQDDMETAQKAYNFSGSYINRIDIIIKDRNISFNYKNHQIKGTLSADLRAFDGSGFQFSQTNSTASGFSESPTASVSPKNKTLSLSDKGIDLIHSSESFRSTPYDDGAGYLTIGFGHKLTSDELKKVNLLRTQGKTWVIDKSEALKLFRQDSQSAINRINKALKIQLNQSQFDSLVSLVYNWGSLENSDILLRINGSKNQGELEEIFLSEFQRVFKARDSSDADNDGSRDDRIGLRGLMYRRGEETAYALAGLSNSSTQPVIPAPSGAQPPLKNELKTYSGIKVSFDIAKFTSDVDYPMVHKVNQGGFAISQQRLAKILTESRGVNYKVGTPLLHTATEYMASGTDYQGLQQYHTGWDFNRGSGNADRGDKVLSASDGIVIFSGSKSTPLGYFVIVEHPQLKQWTRYAHMSDNLQVKEGEIIKKGDLLGFVSNSGDASMYAHLHFDISRIRLSRPEEWNGEYSGVPRSQREEFVRKTYVDPYNFFKGKVDDIK